MKVFEGSYDYFKYNGTGTAEMRIFDNFLKEDQFRQLRDTMIGKDYPLGEMPGTLPWFYNDLIDVPEEVRDRFQFTHTFFDDEQVRSSAFAEFSPIFKNIISPNGVCQLVRVKANLLTRTSKIVQNTFHTDFGVVNNEEKNVLTSIFYINTNNGYTIFEDGTKVESVANRLITFPTDVPHTGTSCTDEKIRVVINFNYIVNTPNKPGNWPSYVGPNSWASKKNPSWESGR